MVVDSPEPASADRTRDLLATLRTSSLAARLGVLGALAVMIVGTGIVHPRFLALGSLANISQQAAFFGIISLGMVFLLAMGEVDLSVGGIYMLCAVISASAIRAGLQPWAGALLAVAVGAALGLVNGALASVLRVPVIIVTLGTLTLYRGLGLVVSGSDTISGQPLADSLFLFLGDSYLGVPAIAWAFLILAIVLAFVFGRTRFGFAVRAIGSNKKAAVLSGYPVPRVLMCTTALVGALAGLSATMTLAFFGSADPNLGTQYELLVIAAAVIGGTALTGGSGTVFGAVLGALVIAVINAALLQFGVSAHWTTFVTGAVIVAAVALDAIVRRVRQQS
jgi:ribose transport system permease protein